MNFFTNLKNAKERVTLLLEKFKHLQDDDMKLMATYYVNEAGGTDAVNNMSAFDFLKMLSDGKLTQPECIRRNRAMIQNERPDLQGTVYKERHKLGEEISKGINC